MKGKEAYNFDYPSIYHQNRKNTHNPFQNNKNDREGKEPNWKLDIERERGKERTNQAWVSWVFLLQLFLLLPPPHLLLWNLIHRQKMKKNLIRHFYRRAHPCRNASLSSFRDYAFSCCDEKLYFTLLYFSVIWGALKRWWRKRLVCKSLWFLKYGRHSYGFGHQPDPTILGWAHIFNNQHDR